MKNLKLRLKRIFVLGLVVSLFFTMICFASSYAKANEGEWMTQIPPSIMLDSGAYSADNVPNAVQNKPYKIFAATAKDMFGAELDVEAKVYLFYSSQTRSRIYLEKDLFTPTCTGIYTVEYTAVDRTGNLSKLTYNVNCLDKSPLSAEVINNTNSAMTGVPVKIGDLLIQNFNGNTGYTVSVVCDGREFKVDDNGYFIPTYVGEYLVTYTFYDYNETSTCSYVINVSANPNPVIFDEVDLQQYYILGETYDIPLPVAYSYEFGYPVKITPSVKICFENGLEYNVEDPSSFIFNKVGEFSIEYSAFFNNKEVSLVKNDLVCVDVGYKEAKNTGKVQADKYFYSKNTVKKEATRNGVKLSTATNDSNVEFINKLLSAEFDMSFGFSSVDNHFNKFKIILTDSLDENQKLVFSLNKVSNTVSDFAINGSVVSKVSSSFYNEDKISFKYNNASRTISVANIENIPISKTVNGDTFDGFTSEFIMMSLEFSEVYGTSSMNIYKINNQTLSTIGDNVSPYLYYDSYSGGKKNLGDKITISRLYLCDVLAPSYGVSYSVLDPYGNYVTDVNGLVLSPENADYKSSYTFVANAYGSYRVSIKIFDAFGRSDQIIYGITVSDSIAPVINIDDKSEQVLKVGDVLTIRSATAIDDISENLTVYTYLLAPTLYTQEYAMGDKVKLNQEGVYYVYYYAYDDAGNVGFAEYKIIVE